MSENAGLHHNSLLSQGREAVKGENENISPTVNIEIDRGLKRTLPPSQVSLNETPW